MQRVQGSQIVYVAPAEQVGAAKPVVVGGVKLVEGGVARGRVLAAGRILVFHFQIERQCQFNGAGNAAEPSISAMLDEACFAVLDRSEEHTSELQSLRHLVC